MKDIRLDDCERKALKKALENFKREVYIFGSKDRSHQERRRYRPAFSSSRRSKTPGA